MPPASRPLVLMLVLYFTIFFCLLTVSTGSRFKGEEVLYRGRFHWKLISTPVESVSEALNTTVWSKKGNAEYVQSMLEIYQTLLPCSETDLKMRTELLRRDSFLNDMVKLKRFGDALVADEELSKLAYDTICKILFANMSELGKVFEKYPEKDCGVEDVVKPILEVVKEVYKRWPADSVLFQLLSSAEFFILLMGLLHSPLTSERLLVNATIQENLIRLESLREEFNPPTTSQHVSKVILTQVGLALLDGKVKSEVSLRPLNQIFSILTQCIPYASTTTLESFALTYLLPSFFSPVAHVYGVSAGQSLILILSRLKNYKPEALVRVLERVVSLKKSNGGGSCLTLQTERASNLSDSASSSIKVSCQDTFFESIMVNLWVQLLSERLVPVALQTKFYYKLFHTVKNTTNPVIELLVVEHLGAAETIFRLTNPYEFENSETQIFILYWFLDGLCQWILKPTVSKKAYSKLINLWILIRKNQVFDKVFRANSVSLWPYLDAINKKLKSSTIPSPTISNTTTSPESTPSASATNAQRRRFLSRNSLSRSESEATLKRISRSPPLTSFLQKSTSLPNFFEREKPDVIMTDASDSHHQVQNYAKTK